MGMNLILRNLAIHQVLNILKTVVLIGDLVVAVVNPPAVRVAPPPAAPNAVALPPNAPPNVVNHTHYFCYTAEKIME